MTAMCRQPVDGTRLDPRVAVLAADAFLDSSREAIGVLQQEPSAGQTGAGVIGKVVVSATNIALAIELYLKAVLIMTGVAVPQTHRLDALFRALPAESRTRVLDSYSNVGPLEDGTVAGWEFELRSPSSDPAPDDAGRVEDMPDPSLEAVLSRNGNIFVSWRYMHEVDPQEAGGSVTVGFEYRLLGDVAAVAQTEAQRLLSLKMAQSSPTPA